MTPRVLAALNRLAAGPQPIDSFAGEIREGLIDAGMSEPPLVDAGESLAFLTTAGRQALDAAIVAPSRAPRARAG